MILNPPSAEALDSSALRAHFNACEVVFTLLHEFEELFDADNGAKETRWGEYVSSSEIELGSALHNLAQANELALKARICRVSPFLPLIGSGVKLPRDSTDVEFADLRTIDAVDLVSTVNAVSGEKISDAYASSIRKLRIDRNRFAHLGILDSTVDVTYFTSLISDQFTALWPDRKWLPTWIALREKGRKAHFSDHKYYTWYTEVMELIPTINAVLSKSQF